MTPPSQFFPAGSEAHGDDSDCARALEWTHRHTSEYHRRHQTTWGGGEGNYDWRIHTQREPGLQAWMPTKEFWWNVDSSFKSNLTTMNYALTMCLEYNYAKC